ncbi:MAG: septum formation inhibitor Maf [Acidobacteria bacterium]|nr:septum formation inhibitor Maf [Acidobacteriota bacterium]
MDLVLASASPRRREILQTAGIAFQVRPADVDESVEASETPEQYVERLAETKARAVWRAGEVTLGADTTVVVDGRILAKPEDAEEATAMLEMLSGRTHEVLTGYCLYDGSTARTGVERTLVRFLPLSAAEIAAYVASGEPFDKAGGYGVQGLASKFIDRIEGCYFNVVGLPAARIYGLLAEVGRDDGR